LVEIVAEISTAANSPASKWLNEIDSQKTLPAARLAPPERYFGMPDLPAPRPMIDFDPARIVPDESKSLADGAIAPWARGDRKLVRDQLAAL